MVDLVLALEDLPLIVAQLTKGLLAAHLLLLVEAELQQLAAVAALVQLVIMLLLE
jgi:hypothetical protein